MHLSDPDRVARAYVMQWMHENGLHDALKALEKEVGLLYDESQLPEASQLMQLVWRHVEERLQQDHLARNKATGPKPSARLGDNMERVPAHHHEEVLQLLRAGAGDYAARGLVAEVPTEVHRSNIIGVRIVPDQNCIITAAGDGHVRCVRYDAGSGAGGGNASEVLWQTRVGSSALLSLALHPGYNLGQPLVAVGAMDGRVTVLHGPSGATIASLQPHAKYVVRVAWAPTTSTQSSDAGSCGSSRELLPGEVTLPAAPSAPMLLLASASTDETVAILRLDLDLGVLKQSQTNGDAGRVGEESAVEAQREAISADEGSCRSCNGSSSNARGGGGGEGGGRSGSWSYDLSQLHESEAEGLGRLTTIKQIPYGAVVTDVTFLRGASDSGLGSGSSSGTDVGTASHGSSTLVVSIRGSNYLRLLDVEKVVLQAEAPGFGAPAGITCTVVPEELVNMNASGDDHVSFTAKHLVASPCGRYLLVCTDSSRLLVLRTSDWSVLRIIFGLPVDQFPQPVAAWHRDSNYIYAAGSGAQLCVFHLGSGRLVHTSVHHKINVRDLDYDPARNLLATCSFDKTVKLLGATAT